MPNHKAKFCQVKGCKEEAMCWVVIPNTQETFYLCGEHPELESATQENYIPVVDFKTGEIILLEVGIYACTPDCLVCDSR